MFVPKIVYKTIILNEEKVQELIDKPYLQRPACACPQTGEITVFKYIIDDRVDFSPERMASLEKFCAEVNSREAEAIAHEAKHLENWAVDLRKFAKTYYEYISLRTLDEVSAFTAGFARDYTHPTPEQIAPYLRAASEYYMGAPYMASYMQEIVPAIDRVIANGNVARLAAENLAYEIAPDELYSPHFRPAINRFFTFGNCILSQPYCGRLEKIDDFRIFKANMKLIKRDQFIVLHDVIQEKIGNIR